MSASRQVAHAALAGAGLLGALLALAAPARAATAGSLFEDGNAAYKAGHFEQAVAAYQEILAYGVADPRVLYNLGNAYFKMGRIGQAIVQYERALRLAPSDQEIRDNLELARGQIHDRPPEPELQYPIRVARDTLEMLPSGPLTATFLVLWFAATGFAGAVPLVRAWDRRRALAIAAFAMGLLALTAGAAVAYQIRIEQAAVAIVLSDKVDVRSGPGEENALLFTLHEGTRVELGDRLDAWIHVNLSNGLSGWVPSSSIERV
jgi:tetratricopeptide (TPR) repeat protein